MASLAIIQKYHHCTWPIWAIDQNWREEVGIVPMGGFGVMGRTDRSLADPISDHPLFFYYRKPYYLLPDM